MFVIIIVNYNKNIYDAETIKSILDIDKKEVNNFFKIIIWDNIPYNGNETIINSNYIKNLIYIPSDENKGLAYIYNQIIEKYITEKDYMVLLDNDSKIPKEYFYDLNKIVEKYKEISLYIPKIYSKNNLYSPCKEILLFLKFFKKNNINGIISSKKIFAINSGMIISGNYIKKYNFKYDSKLKFYGTDNYFMQLYREREAELFVLDIAIEHSISGHENESIEKKLWRFNDLKNSLWVLMSLNNIILKLYYLLFILAMSLKKFIVFKDLRFLNRRIK